MASNEFNDLVRRYWEAEAAGRSANRAERLRVRSAEGDLYYIDDEISNVMSERERGDRFVLSALECTLRPNDDWVVAWLGGITIDDAIRNGDTDIIDRLVAKGMDRKLAERIRTFIS